MAGTTLARSLRGALPWLLACALVGSVSGASAQPSSLPSAPLDDDTRPWARGVSEAEQEVARGLYAEGNAEFAESRFAQALAKYREAIRHWDHPAIRFNMAVSLINLDQLVEAKDNLEHSLLFRATPLGGDVYTQALTYRKLLDAQLAHVKATCSEAGAVVTLDGKYLFTAPGSADQFLLPGEHQITATKPGLRTAVVRFTGVAGQLASFDLQPTPEMRPPRWQYWKHVLGGGAGLVVAGTVSYVWSYDSFRRYDSEIDERCKPRGCSAEMIRALTDLNTVLAGARTKQTVAFSLFGVGSAAILVGVLGLILDQPKVRPDAGHAVPVVTAAPGGGTVSLRWGF